MAHYHFTIKAVSRKGGKSTVAKLAYRSATDLKDLRNGETYYYSNRCDVFHVDILLPEGAPQWIIDLALECQTDRQSALQKLSNIFEAAEKRIDARVYREAEFALPNELTDEQNIEWSKEFVRDFFCKKGMVAIVNYHQKVDKETGISKPHCHVLLSTRNLTDEGLDPHKNREWDSQDLVDEGREAFANYQNAALARYGFDVRVTHLSYEDRELDIEAQPKLGQNVREMTARGMATDKQKIFDIVRLKNQFKIVKNPEIVFKIVTSMHATFTRKDIAKVLHRYIDDAQQFRVLLDRLMTSKELVNLESSGIHRDTEEPVYTTQEMLRVELNLIRQADHLSTKNTHGVSAEIVEKVIARHHEKFKKHGGLSPDQEAAIRHMLAGSQISCVVGFAGAGKTTCLEAVREAWEEAGYKILGIAPTGKAARNIEGCGIRSMTIHKFLFAQKGGRERISDKTILVADEFGMVDSRRCSELLSLMTKTGAKVVPMGDGNQAQSVEAGAAFRLLTERAQPAVLEKVIRQQTEWQRDATRQFGTLQARSAVMAYLERGCFTIVQEEPPLQDDPNSVTRRVCLDHFCLARQMSGRIWKEMMEDFKAEFETDSSGKDVSFNPETNFETLAKHQDFGLFKRWKKTREALVKKIIHQYEHLEEDLKAREVNIKVLSSLVSEYKEDFIPSPAIFREIESVLRKMSYKHIADTRESTREALVKAWAEGYQASPDHTHLMLAFTNRDANKLNVEARTYMREQGKIKGKDYEFVTQSIETDEFGIEHRTDRNRTFAKGDRILFTRNNNSLNVKNGSLGTILSIAKRKMTVALDTEGSEHKTVSFSPKLYPFIDNGWATTIIKAQGVTVDHVKLLASFEQYRNLAYVGMSRHRLSLQIFASNLDFWREEKIVDRLGRVQEKLSSFDYLDADKIQEKLKEDTEVLWHHQKIQQGKDFWKAIKVTARDVFDKALGRSQGEKEEEEFQSFDDSEEMRSRDFFEDAYPTRGKGAFDDEGEGELKDREARATPQRNPNGSFYANDDKKYGQEKQSQEDKPQSARSDTDQGPQSSSTAPHDHNHISTMDPDTGKSEPQNPGSLGQHSSPKGQDPSTTESSASKEQPSTERKQNERSQSNENNPSSLSFQGEEKVDDKIKTIKDKINSEYESKIVIQKKYPTFKEVEDQLRERIFELATSFIDKPITLNTSRELRFGKEREIRVVLSGEYKGFYHNFETGVKGGPLKLIEEQEGLSSRDALKRAADWLGGSQIIIERHVRVKKKDARTEKQPEWKPILPVPKGQENPNIASTNSLKVMLRDGWKEVARYAYRDEEGNLKGYVVRLDKRNGDKVSKKTPPLAYCVNEKGDKEWRWLGFEKENKTPYKIEVLSTDLTKPILVVEGEKTADAAQKLLPDYHVLTWGGGAGNVDKTNWQCLVGKTVAIWPDYDYDQTGQEAAKKLQTIITQLNKDADKEGCVGIVDLLSHLSNPHDLPDKWDLADKLPEGWDIESIRTYLKKAIDQSIQNTPDHSNVQKENITEGGEDKPKGESSQPFDTHTHPHADASGAIKGKVNRQREEFDASRLSFHQEWCATLGFMAHHKRFPENAEELSAAYWQGERLTAIEGRLYKETLGKGCKPNEKELMLQARKELSKNQVAPDHILMFGKASDLTHEQLKQFEQHVLIHQDRTNQLPNPSELDTICQVVKIHNQAVHNQVMERGKIDQTSGQQGSPSAQTQNSSQKSHGEITPQPLAYHALIDQQAILASTQKGQEINVTTLKTKEIQSSCAEKLSRMDDKMRSMSNLTQEMRDHDLNRQNSRGMEL